VTMLRGPRTRIAVVVVAAAMTMAGWLASSPHGSSPDDGYHLAGIWCARGFVEGRCQFVGDGLETGEVFVPYKVAELTCYAQQPAVDASCAAERLASDFNDLSPAPGKGNIAGERPGVYYAAMHVLIGEDVSRSISLMRASNALLALIMLALTLRIARPSVRQALIGSWLVTSVPLGLFLLTSTNSGAWGLIGLGTYWAALLTAIEPGTRTVRLQGTAIAVVSALMAIGSRLEALPYIALSTLLVAIVAWRPSITQALWGTRTRAITTAASIAVVVLAAASWRGLGYARSGWEEIAGGFAAWEERGVGDALFYNLMELPTLIAGALGWWPLGWLDTKMPALVYVPALAAFAALGFTGLGSTDRRKVVAVPLIALSIVTYPLLVHASNGLLIYEEYQPRQFMVLLYLLVAFALLVPPGRRTIDLRRSQRVAIVVSVAVAQAIALHVNTRRYVSGLSTVWLFDLDQDVAWWWGSIPSPMTMWWATSIAFTVLATIAIGVFRPGTHAPQRSMRSTLRRPVE